MIEKEGKNLSKNVAIKRAKSNASALALSSDSNINEVNTQKFLVEYNNLD